MVSIRWSVWEDIQRIFMSCPIPHQAYDMDKPLRCAPTYGVNGSLDIRIRIKGLCLDFKPEKKLAVLRDGTGPRNGSRL